MGLKVFIEFPEGNLKSSRGAWEEDKRSSSNINKRYITPKLLKEGFVLNIVFSRTFFFLYITIRLIRESSESAFKLV